MERIANERRSNVFTVVLIENPIPRTGIDEHGRRT
jgi:hypothetical protein